MQAAKTTVERRVNGLGVTEPLVQMEGNNRIIVELPGISNPDAAVQTIRSTGQLEFVEFGPASSTNGAPTSWPNIQQGVYVRTDDSNHPPSSAITNTVKDPYPNQVFKTIMTGRYLSQVGTQLNSSGQPNIAFQLTSDGAKIFGDYTTAHVGDVLGIVLDNIVLSAPRINSAIPDGSGIIEGSFTLDEANNLAVQMRYGSLPVPLDVVDRRTIGATLGSDSVRHSVLAGLVGLIIVILFMIAQYRLPGVVAAVALLIYMAFNLALYKLIPVTLTLPGIAGFLLLTGMAVDANVLIFERMKEELRWGRSLEYAVNAAFHRAWPSIRDSNLFDDHQLCRADPVRPHLRGAAGYGLCHQPGPRCADQHVYRRRRHADLHVFAVPQRAGRGAARQALAGRLLGRCRDEIGSAAGLPFGKFA